MAISAAQKVAIEQVIETIIGYSVGIGKGRQKRELAAEFMALPDREVWADYYQVIPEPRCLSGIKNGVEKGDYKNVQQVYSDLNLVFSNALWFNEEHSQVAKDATMLKAVLEKEWNEQPGLPPPQQAAVASSSLPKGGKTGKKSGVALAPTTPQELTTPTPLKAKIRIPPASALASNSSSQTIPPLTIPTRPATTQKILSVKLKLPPSASAAAQAAAAASTASVNSTPQTPIPKPMATPRTAPPPKANATPKPAVPTKTVAVSLPAPSPASLPAPVQLRTGLPQAAPLPAPIPAIPAAANPVFSSAPTHLPIPTTLVPPLPSSRHSSAEPEDAADSSAEPDYVQALQDVAARDGEAEALVSRLENSLPRWAGPGEGGWMAEAFGGQAKYATILEKMKIYTAPSGDKPVLAFDELPEESKTDNLSFQSALSFSLIEQRVAAQEYNSTKVFELDMARLFEKGRRTYTPTTQNYGRVILLQRIYNYLSSPSSSPATSLIASTTNFASVTAGPCNARSIRSDPEGGVLSYRILPKDRTPTDVLEYKGWTICAGDYVHLINPDDPARPIIAQVFKCWKLADQPSITVCWYYRPEQTFHPIHRQFWENEVFKTGYFVDHKLEDVIEKVGCQFASRHIRGRPRPPHWYPSWPLYVCDSRYTEHDRKFVRIKNWVHCIPEELRPPKVDFIPIYPFERTIYPKRYGSPFIQGVKGPGGIGDAIERVIEPEKVDPGVLGRKRPRRGVAAQLEAAAQPQLQPAGPPMRPGATPHTGASLPAQYSGAGGIGYFGAGAGGPYLPSPQAVAPMRRDDRSILHAAGGQAVQGSATIEKLHEETVSNFDRDPETNEMLWFSGAPIDVAKAPMPKYSLDYLYFLAMKKKAGSGDGKRLTETERGGHQTVVNGNVDGTTNGINEGDDEWTDGFPNKRKRTELPVPRLTGEALWAALLATPT